MSQRRALSALGRLIWLTEFRVAMMLTRALPRTARRPTTRHATKSMCRREFHSSKPARVNPLLLLGVRQRKIMLCC